MVRSGRRDHFRFLVADGRRAGFLRGLDFLGTGNRRGDIGLLLNDLAKRGRNLLPWFRFHNLLGWLWNFFFILDILIVVAIISSGGLAMLVAFAEVALGNRNLS